MDEPVLDGVLEQNEQTLARLDKLEAPKRKDLWDKLSAISTAFSSIVLASVGLYFTSYYSIREHARERAEDRRLQEQEERQMRVDLTKQFSSMLVSSDPVQRQVAINWLAMHRY